MRDRLKSSHRWLKREPISCSWLLALAFEILSLFHIQCSVQSTSSCHDRSSFQRRCWTIDSSKVSFSTVVLFFFRERSSRVYLRQYHFHPSLILLQTSGIWSPRFLYQQRRQPRLHTWAPFTEGLVTTKILNARKLAITIPNLTKRNSEQQVDHLSDDF